MMIRTRTPVRANQVIPVAIELPTLMRPLRVMARVIYARRVKAPTAQGEIFAMGVRFEQMAGPDQGTLAEYLAKFGQ